MKDLKKKIFDCIKMFEVIYSNQKEFNVGTIRLWRLKRLRDKVKDYLPIVDMNDAKYITKKIARDIDYVYIVFKTIVEEKENNKNTGL